LKLWSRSTSLVLGHTDTAPPATLSAQLPLLLASLRFTVLPGAAGAGATGAGDERLDYLSVERRTGRLRLSAAIDRDVICRQRVTCSLTFGVAVHPAQ